MGTDILAFTTSRFSRLIVDWSVKKMLHDMTPYTMSSGDGHLSFPIITKNNKDHQWLFMDRLGSINLT